MSETKHTPGPWAILNPKAKFATIGTRGPSGPIRHIAEACWNDEQGNADARLIAAAPDMAEALREIAEQDITELALDPDWSRRIARAALSKVGAVDER